MSLKDRLDGKTRRVTHYDLALSDPSAAEVEEADAAKRALDRAVLVADDPDSDDTVTQARSRLDKAAAALSVHVERINFRGMSPHAWDALEAEHPPTAEQMTEHEAAVKAAKPGQAPPVPGRNLETFLPALFAACVVTPEGESPLTEAEWVHQLRRDGDWQDEERYAAFQACASACLIPRSVVIPKG